MGKVALVRVCLKISIGFGLPGQISFGLSLDNLRFDGFILSKEAWLVRANLT